MGDKLCENASMNSENLIGRKMAFHLRQQTHDVENLITYD